jgi:hypothetical protein
VVEPGRAQRFLPAIAAALALGGCAGERATGPRGVASEVTLAATEYALYGGALAAGPLQFPAAGDSGAQYLVVAQLATGVPDLRASFLLAGAAVASSSAGHTESAAASAAAATPVPLAIRFHDTLRRLDERAALRSIALPRGRARAGVAGPATAPAPGDTGHFRVCADLYCSGTVAVTATAQVVGAHSAIFVDDSAPAGGFQAADLARLAAQFDSVLYPIDTAAFGPPSDIDHNGVVVVLLTPKVNALTPLADCATSVITGFFLGEDLAPSTRAAFNDGEVLYGLVPDPQGTVSCGFTVTDVEEKLGPTFIHELQHMISFNQRVLIRFGVTEDLWLSEGLSHLAEELGGRRYDSLGQSATAQQFYFGDLDDAFRYMVTPASNPLVTLIPPGGLEARGAAWLFVRYLVDHFGALTTRRLVQTSLQGVDNVVNVTGTAFDTLVGRWALALYVSDLPGFVPDSSLTFRDWTFRSTYASLHGQDPADFFLPFPLVPGLTTATIFSQAGTLASGSGNYLLVTQQPGAAPLNLTFTSSSGAALPTVAGPQLAVVRLR